MTAGTSDESGKIAVTGSPPGKHHQPDGMQSTGQPLAADKVAMDKDDIKRGEERTQIHPKVDLQIQAHLGRLLRANYKALVEEPVPEKLLKIIEDLDRTESTD